MLFTGYNHPVDSDIHLLNNTGSDLVCPGRLPIQLRNGPLENFFLGGGGGRAKYKKKYSRKGKLNEKNSCTPINPKKYSCYGLKKII